MSSLQAAKKLMDLGVKGDYVFNTGDLAALFFQPQEERRIENTIRQLVRTNILVRVKKGIYICKPFVDEYVLHKIAARAQCRDFLAESLETAGSKWGLIGQLYPSYLSVITTGKSAEIITQWGTINFTHVNTSRSQLYSECVFREPYLPITNEDTTLSYIEQYGSCLTKNLLKEELISRNESDYYE